MKDLLTIDFETFYDPSSGYSLTKMGTEEYILDPQFQAYGCAVAFNQEPPNFLSMSVLPRYFAEIDWANTRVAAHNAKFDCAILLWRFKCKPAEFIDTVGIANRFIVPYTGRASLDACFKHMGMPQKSGVLTEVKGLRYEDIIVRPGLWERVTDYACHDLVGCREIVNRYYPLLTVQERCILSWTVDAYVRSRARLDVEQLEAILEKLELERQSYKSILGVSETQLRSRDGYARLLEKHGIVVQYKEGKNEDIPAIAKDDPFIKELLAHDRPEIRFLAMARLAFSSNLEITRTKRLISMARATKGLMLFPLNYSAARTGRFGGGDKVNPQNFGRKSPIKRAIKALPGYVFVQVDQSQIEARLVAYVAGCLKLVDAFREKRDVYSEFATTAYGYPVNKKDHPIERQVGKVSILQLGYQSGGAKLQRKLNDSGVNVTLEEAEFYKNTYRSEFNEIPTTWYHMQRMLARAIRYGEDIDWIMGMKFTNRGIRVPSGNWLLYDQMQLSDKGVPCYYDPRYKSINQLYGGAIMENICQTIARDVTNETLIRFHKSTILQVHDNVVRLVKVEDGERELERTLRSMRIVPEWLHYPPYGVMPLDAEGYLSPTFEAPE